MKDNSFTIFGEVLFDHFPDGKSVLGGAPLNVAWHLQAFRQNHVFISRIGDDSDGDKIRTAMQSWGMKTDFLQTDLLHPTGQVDVRFIDGEPSYNIVENQSYDHIELAPLHTINRTGILYHGTLAARSITSNSTLSTLKRLHLGKIFVDINLREPWWNKNKVLELIRDADWIKLNIDELKALNGNINDIKSSMASLLTDYDMQGIILTCGEVGASILNSDGEYYNVSPAIKTDVIDTVGAGDAFSTVMLLGINLGWELELTMQRAQEFASAIIGRNGATVSDINFYKPFIAAWHL
ncbi:MAG: carbohydrate kinase [Methylococcaceae bacterium]|nr:carbohydrate kinase [Methylococcaceae bacterium]